MALGRAANMMMSITSPANKSSSPQRPADVMGSWLTAAESDAYRGVGVQRG